MPETNTTEKSQKEIVITYQRYQLILDFIHEYRRVKRISPKFQEIAVGIGYSVKAAGTVYTHVDNLIRMGWLEKVGGARSLLPTKSPDEKLCKITDPDLKRIHKKQRNLQILRRL